MTLEEMIGQFKAYTEYPNQDTFVISNQECKDILKYLTEQKSFIEWVASEVVSEYWEFNNDGFAEIACRKLVKLGIVKEVDGEYIFENSQPVEAQEPCEDAISRDELLKAIDTWDKFGCDADTKLVPYQDHYIPYIHYDDVVKSIKGMPSVTPQPKTGHWIEEFNDLEGEVRFTCSSCGKYQLFGTDYCPNCGAKMTESEVEK